MSFDISKATMTMRDVIVIGVFLVGLGVTVGFVKWTGESNENEIESFKTSAKKEFNEVNQRVYNLNVRVEEYKSMQEVNKALFQSYQDNMNKRMDKLEEKMDYLIELEIEKNR